MTQPSAIRQPANFVLPTDRGGYSAANGKPSDTVDQAARSITRDGYSLNGTGVTGTPAVVTYAFRATSGAMPLDTVGFARFNAAQITATEAIMAGWSDVANVTFVRSGSGTTGANVYSDNATMLFGNYITGNAGAAAFTFYPGDTSNASQADDIWVNTSLSYEVNPTLYDYGYLTLAHEIGHAIGLEDAEYLDPGYGSPSYSVNAGYFEDTQQYSVMSYWSASNSGADFGALYAAAPMMDDIAAAQKLYGANMTTRTGDTVYGFNSNADRAWFQATSAGTPVIFAVWDAGGIDTFDFSGYAQDAVIDLRATHFSSVGGLIGNVSIAQGVTIENAIGGSGNDVFYGNAADNTLNGGAGNDAVDYSAVKAALTVSLAAGTATAAGIGHDTLIKIETVIGGSGADSLTGDNNGNWLYGGNGKDILTGGGGNDYLNGGTGTDVMYGGSGNDTYVVDNITDVISEQTVAGVDDGGVDTVISYATYTLGDGFENLTLTGTSNISGTGNNLNNVITGNAASNVLSGGGGNDVIYDGDAYTGIISDAGGAFHGSIATALAISPAAFSLAADADIENATTVGHATIQGTGDGTLRMYSFTAAKGATATFDIDHTFGMDSYLRLYDAAGNLIAEDDDAASLSQGAGGSTSASDSYLSWTFAAGGTYYIEVSEYSHDAVAVGDTYELNFSLANNGAVVGGNDVIDGGAGADAMHGGLGNDTYYVDNTGDTVSEDANAGVDLVNASVSFTLGANVDNLTLNGGNLDGTGNGLANVLVGTAGNNILTGFGGDDIMFAGAGNDTLNGGDGVDTADYSSDTAGFTASLTGGTAQGSGIGSDTLTAMENITGGSGKDNLTGTDLANVLKGGAGADTLIGLGSADVLDGGAGADIMRGGSGADTYYVDDVNDVISEETVAGIDDTGVELVYSSVTYTLGKFLDNMTLTGSLKINGTGNNLNNILTGNGHANLLAGMDGNDTLIGGDGGDKLDGGTGADTMFGGSGDDTYVIDNVSDKASEQTVAGIDDGGYDSVISSVTWSLGDFFENLTLTGTANLNATGNDDNNTIIGNDGDNVITGKDGWDTLRGAGGNDYIDGGFGLDSMYGGAGNDTYIVDNTGDFVSEMLGGVDGGGNDIVYASATFTLNNFIETLVLTGTGLIDGTGSGQANTIFGNSSNNRLFGGGGDDVLDGKAGNDQLDGGDGADRMVGGLGNDTYSVENVGDIVVEQANQGIDTIKTNLNNYALLANFENLTLTGSAAINGYGNGVDNVLTGNSADNALYGGKGNDTLIGGGGNDQLDGGEGGDTMSGGSGNDTYSVENTGDAVIENANDGTDMVRTNLATYTLTANVEVLVMTGSGNNTGIGNDGNNTIVGNAGNNTLMGGLGNDNLQGGDGNDWLDGGAGGDKLYGGAGDDTYVYGVGDTIIENENAGIDTVLSSVTSMTLGYTLENITLIDGGVNATGNALDNIITGNSANNRLAGGLGADTFRFLTGSGVDTILDFQATQNDRIDLHAYNAQGTAVITQVGADTKIDLGGGNLITVLNTQAGDVASHIIW